MTPPRTSLLAPCVAISELPSDPGAAERTSAAGDAGSGPRGLCEKTGSIGHWTSSRLRSHFHFPHVEGVLSHLPRRGLCPGQAAHGLFSSCLTFGTSSYPSSHCASSAFSCAPFGSSLWPPCAPAKTTSLIQSQIRFLVQHHQGPSRHLRLGPSLDRAPLYQRDERPSSAHLCGFQLGSALSSVSYPPGFSCPGHPSDSLSTPSAVSPADSPFSPFHFRSPHLSFDPRPSWGGAPRHRGVCPGSKFLAFGSPRGALIQRHLLCRGLPF